MIILGIETSCDETSAAVVENGCKVLSCVIASSASFHAKYGGIIPEIAAREHIRQIIPVINETLTQAKINIKDIGAVAVAEKPGLISSLLVGINTAEVLSKIYKKPLIYTNHIYGHIYSNWLDRKKKEFKFPIITLTASGGHNELVLIKKSGALKIIGQTIDDAAGEAFDKGARILGFLPPSGAVLAGYAENGDKNRYHFPRSLLGNSFNFSFSGVKTSLLYKTQKIKKMTLKSKKDLAASYQEAIVQVLAKKLILAAKKYKAKEIHIAGGVSANIRLRKIIQKNTKIPLKFPKKMVYCTDNAAMIAGAGYYLKT